MGEIRRRCRLLIVDEFQDTDFAQRDLAFAIAGESSGPQLFLVGDPKQSIYRFRGADISVWNAVEEAMGERGRLLSLTQSFRSTPAVIGLVNGVASNAMAAAAEEIRTAGLPSAVDYADLVPHRDDGGVGATEVLHISSGRGKDKRLEEGDRCGAFIHDLVTREQVMDPETGELRSCRFGDVALLYRASTDVELVAHGLREGGVPFRMAGAPHLEKRMEVLDQVNLIRLLLNPADDLRAFAFLRSPFACLRDDVLARMRVLGNPRPLLQQARNFLQGDRWSPADWGELENLEREGLTRALEALDKGRALLTRRPLDEVVSRVLDETGYREHRVLLPGHEEALSNIHGFLRMLETYRGLSPGQFLEMWDRWAGEDVGIPQAALHSTEDDVVTLSTIHAAKGLEWPVVVLIKGESRAWREPSNNLVTDRVLGPVVVPKKDDRGDRAAWIVERERLEEIAEETRLFYVAMTRARDRLLVLDYPKSGNPSYCKWLSPAARPDSLTVVQPQGTGTVEHAVPALDWLGLVEGQDRHPSDVLPLDRPQERWVTSATEMMTRAKDPEAWERKYRHGVLASWEFTRSEPGDAGVPSHVRGTVIHGVLERIREEEELAEILDETIGSLDDPDLESTLGPGTEYREALEKEIGRGDQWAGVGGVHQG